MNAIEILPDDTRWIDHAEEGEPDCLCSRCGELIPERVVAIRAWPEDGRFELRYHPECLGFETFDEDGETFDGDHETEYPAP